MLAAIKKCTLSIVGYENTKLQAIKTFYIKIILSKYKEIDAVFIVNHNYKKAACETNLEANCYQNKICFQLIMWKHKMYKY